MHRYNSLATRQKFVESVIRVELPTGRSETDAQFQKQSDLSLSLFCSPRQDHGGAKKEKANMKYLHL